MPGHVLQRSRPTGRAGAAAGRTQHSGSQARAGAAGALERTSDDPAGPADVSYTPPPLSARAGDRKHLAAAVGSGSQLGSPRVARPLARRRPSGAASPAEAPARSGAGAAAANTQPRSAEEKLGVDAATRCVDRSGAARQHGATACVCHRAPAQARAAQPAACARRLLSARCCSRRGGADAPAAPAAHANSALQPAVGRRSASRRPQA